MESGAHLDASRGGHPFLNACIEPRGGCNHPKPSNANLYEPRQTRPHRKFKIISHEVFMKSFLGSQFPQKSVNIFFISVIVKDKLTDSWGS